MPKKEKIIIADDSTFTRSVLRSILEDNGYENIVEVQNGNELLERVELEKPDLILLDMIMPKLSGFEVLKKIGKKWKIIVVSAVEQEEIVNEVKDFGVAGYITKPFNEGGILREVNKVLS